MVENPDFLNGAAQKDLNKYMIDQYGREIDYLRISITDKCNLHCKYCMPVQDTESKKNEDHTTEQKMCAMRQRLSYEEIRRLVHIFSELGMKKVKITGGEPLLRKDACRLISMCKKEYHMESVTITTNGVLLETYLEELHQAGTDGINISLDTMDPEKYQKITGENCVEKVKKALICCADKEQFQVKINCVLLDQEWEELSELIELTRTHRISVRFIEQMPIGHGTVEQSWTEERIKEQLKAEGKTLKAVSEKLGNGPAYYIQIKGYKGTIGFISAMSHKFCDKCNRVRLTADGFLKPCLQYGKGTDLLKLLRSKASDEEIRREIEDCIYKKPHSHHMEDRKSGGIETENMAEIGG